MFARPFDRSTGEGEYKIRPYKGVPMMKWQHREPRYDSGPNLTPLVDVVLVVLIFLMLGGAMAAPRVLT